MALPWSDRLLNDDHTDIKVVTPQTYGFAQADATKQSRKRKHPLGFTQHESKRPEPKKRSK